MSVTRYQLDGVTLCLVSCTDDQHHSIVWPVEINYWPKDLHQQRDDESWMIDVCPPPHWLHWLACCVWQLTGFSKIILTREDRRLQFLHHQRHNPTEYSFLETLGWDPTHIEYVNWEFEAPISLVQIFNWRFSVDDDSLQNNWIIAGLTKPSVNKM